MRETGNQIARGEECCSTLESEGKEQHNLFCALNMDKQARIMQALDTVKTRFGRDTLFYTGSGIEGDWKMQRNMKSASFTTDWDVLPRVKAWCRKISSALRAPPLMKRKG